MKFLLPLFITTLLSATQYTQTIKEKKIYPMGKKIYEHKCKKIDLTQYDSIKNLTQEIQSQHLCKPLKEKYLEALTLYLFEIKKQHIDTTTVLPPIKVTTKEKCPVCGMFVYKYPRWAAQIFYQKQHYSFDGMKDLMKWYFEYPKNIKHIYVKDYYSQKTIDATQAFYVFGSDVYGPMGNELIAFKNLQQAKDFSMDHRGKKIIAFKDITKDMIYALD